MGGLRYTIFAAALPAAMLASCSGEPELKEFAVTKAGNKVLDGGDYCTLNKDQPNSETGRMSVIAGKKDGERTLGFSAADLRIGDQTSADYSLIFFGIDGQPTDYAPPSVRYLQQGSSKVISMKASDKVMVFLSLTRDVAFVFNGKIVGRYTQKTSYRQDLEVLARCAGMPLERLLGIEGR